MIKKLIGIFVAVAVTVIVVVTAIRRDGFRSLVLRDEIMNQSESVLKAGTQTPDTTVAIDVVDSVVIVGIDSIALEPKR